MLAKLPRDTDAIKSWSVCVNRASIWVNLGFEKRLQDLVKRHGGAGGLTGRADAADKGSWSFVWQSKGTRTDSLRFKPSWRVNSPVEIPKPFGVGRSSVGL
jgi:hypothetical protein